MQNHTKGLRPEGIHVNTEEQAQAERIRAEVRAGYANVAAGACSTACCASPDGAGVTERLGYAAADLMNTPTARDR